MASGSIWEKKIRKLLPEDLPSIGAHLRRLDEEGLHSRFGSVVSEAFLFQYVERMPDLDTTILGCCVNGAVRGVGELRRLEIASDLEAEAALTVEGSFIDLGIGTALMAALIAEARRLGLRDIFMGFGPFNHRMRRLTQKFHGLVSFEGQDCVGRISIEFAGDGPGDEPVSVASAQRRLRPARPLFPLFGGVGALLFRGSPE